MFQRLRSAWFAIAKSTLCLLLPGLLLSSCNEPRWTPSTNSLTVETPANGSVVTTLTTIGGSYTTYLEVVTGVDFQLIRMSDGKCWDGTSWDGFGSAVLPASFGDPLGGDWQSTGALPSGMDLADGYYNIRATAHYEDGGSWREDSVFAVGVEPPPVTLTPMTWGESANGKLGAGAVPDANALIPVFMRGALEGKNVVQVATGGEHTLALTSEGRVYAWGANTHGQLGNGTTTASDVPVEVDLSGAANHNFIRIAAGDLHSLAMNNAGQIFAWGSNEFGQLGNGTTTASPVMTPVQVLIHGNVLSGDEITREISAGSGFSVLLGNRFRLYAWGRNDLGQLGDGTTTHRSVPVAVQGTPFGQRFSFIESGASHTMAISEEGKVWCFGWNDSGRLGNGTTLPSTVAVQSGTTGVMADKIIVRISAGWDHSLAVSSEGKVYAWGAGGAGQLGDGGTSDRLSPVELPDIQPGQPVAQIAAGKNFSAAVTSADGLFTWGNNQFGTLIGGTPFNQTSLTPVQAAYTTAAGRKILSIRSGFQHGALLTGFPPLPEARIMVEAQGNSLTGQGFTPVVDFGSQANGSSTPVLFTVRNVGKANLTDIAIGIEGAASGDYFAAPATLPPLAPNATASFNLFFTPNASGLREADLRIYSNATNMTRFFEVNLEGTGYTPGVPTGGFNAGADDRVLATAMQPDGKILLGGAFITVQPPGTPSLQARGGIARLNADGTLDTAFHPNADDTVHCVAVQHDGKVLIGGQFTTLQPGGGGPVHNRHFLARLNSDGTVDTGFNTLAGTLVNGLVRAIVPLPGGQILIAGQFTSINDGSGAVTRARLAKLNEDGTLDAVFDPAPDGEVLTVAVDRSNRIIAGGLFSNIGGASRHRFARLDEFGAADSLDPAAILSVTSVHSVAIEEDGGIIVGGEFTAFGGITLSNAARVKPDGAVDEYFAPNPNGRVTGINVATDGSILLAGTFTTVQPSGEPTPTARNRMARFYPGGSLDAFFNPDFNNEVNGAAVQADGMILAAGNFTQAGTTTVFRLARVTGNSVIEELTVPSLSYIHWQRQGGLPQTMDASFDLSTDGGSTWTPLTGTVSRSITGWQMTGISLPGTGRVRARARTHGGHGNGSSGLVENVVIFGEPPQITVIKEGNPVFYGHEHDFGVVRAGESLADIAFTIQNTGSSALSGFKGATLEDPAANFELTLPSAASLTTGATTNLYITYRPKSKGAHTAVLHIPSNDPDVPVFDIILNGSGGLPITTWKQAHFSQTENTGAAADAAMPAGDGMTNLEKYARNLDPNEPTTRQDTLDLSGNGPLPPGQGETASDGPVMHYTYVRNKLALADVVFQVEWSETLDQNDWHTTGVTEEILADDGTEQQVRATVPFGTAGRRFVRLKITRP